MTAAIRALLHTAIDAGLLRDTTIAVPDRESVVRNLAALKEQGWEVNDDEPIMLGDERWHGTAKIWEPTLVHVHFVSSEPAA